MVSTLYFNIIAMFCDRLILFAGGLLANNPTVDTLTDMFECNSAYRKKGQFDKVVELGCVLAMGTGRWPIKEDKIVTFESGYAPTTLMSNLKKHQKVTTQLAVVATQADNYIVDRGQAWCGSLNACYFRLSPPLSEQSPLDCTDDNDMVQMLWEAKSFCVKQAANLDRIAFFLEGSAAKPFTTLTLEQAFVPPPDRKTPPQVIPPVKITPSVITKLPSSEESKIALVKAQGSVKGADLFAPRSEPSINIKVVSTDESQIEKPKRRERSRTKSSSARRKSSSRRRRS